MSARNLCRLCLTMDMPLRVIADSPLQDIYEKLTQIPLKSLHRPVVACCVCYAQLRKCYNLMVRSVRANEVLTQILQRGEMGEEEFVAIINRCRPGDGLTVTPTELVTFACTEHSLKMEIMEDPLSSQCRDEIETDKEIFVARLKLEVSEDEGDTEGVTPEKMDDIESEGLIDQEYDQDVKLEILEEAVDIEEHELTCGDDLKLDEIEEVQTMDTKVLIHDEDTRQGVSGARVHEDVSDAAPSNKCNQTKDKNIMGRLRKRGAVLEEDISSRNTGSYKFRTRVINRHTDTRRGNKILHCDICKQTFMTKSKLNKHLRTHTGEKPFECEICQVKFSLKFSLKTHLRTHSGEKPFQCEICQVKFSYKCHLKTHLRTHTGEKPFECEICQVKFNQKSSLRRHLRTHTSEKPFECEICQVKFNQNFSLRRHLRTHTGEKPFECEICQVKFNQKSSLKTHLRTHTGEKPFECRICQVKFSVKSNLKTHLRTHTGEKPFECEICQVKFNHKSHLKTHLRTHAGKKN